MSWLGWDRLANLLTVTLEPRAWRSKSWNTDAALGAAAHIRFPLVSCVDDSPNSV